MVWYCIIGTIVSRLLISIPGTILDFGKSFSLDTFMGVNLDVPFNRLASSIGRA